MAFVLNIALGLYWAEEARAVEETRRQNLEQKFPCRYVSPIIDRCRAMRYKFHSRGRQEDLYFATKQGRLKIRLAGDEAELIYYLRLDSKEPRVSDYFRLPCQWAPKCIPLMGK